ncbi:MAG: hypothetical protein AABX51_02545 [Nanoarchaeota archaeon]
MKLTTIIRNIGFEPEKILVPKNKGLKEYRDVALGRLGIEKSASYLIEARAENIPELCDYFTGKGEIVFGLTGDDLVDEYRLRNPQSLIRIIDTTDWYDPNARFGRPTLCFLGKEGDSIESLEEGEVVFNEKYEATSRQYLDELTENTGFSFGIFVVNGGTEEAYANGVGRYAIETVYSGSSIDRFGLICLDRIRQSDVDLVTSWPSTKPDAFRNEYSRLEDRLRNPTESETSRILADLPATARKVVEEGYELAEASILGTGRVKEESADLIYRLFSVCVQNGISYDALNEEMLRRQG